MKNPTVIFLCLITILISSCGPSKNISDKTEKSTAIASERTDISLLDRIRKKNGIVIRNGVPLLNKAANSFSSEGSQEPLYVVNSQIIGNSFRSVNELVDSFNVKSIRVLSGAEASSYGTQGGKGVILITTYN